MNHIPRMQSDKDMAISLYADGTHVTIRLDASN